MDQPTPVIELSNVVVTHRDVVVLDDITLSVRKGEFVAIIGPNGAGKTTLLKVMLGIIRPVTGTVKLFGKPVRELGSERSKIGYVPQIIAVDLGFPISVYETVLMGAYGQLGIARRPTRADRERAMKALDKVGASDLKDRPISRLSGGQRQRVFIARALVNDPELLLLDEPTTGVDVEATGNVYTLLKEFKARGVTTVMVSHDLGVVADYLDTLACLNKSLVAHGRPDDVMYSEALSQMYGCHAAFLHHGGAPHIVVEDH